MNGTTGSGSPLARDRRNGFWINAIVGVGAAVVWSMLPLVGALAPLVGGAVAGYLQNTGELDGVKVGAVAGLIGAVPVLLVVFLVTSFVGLVGLADGGLVAGGAIGVFGIVAILAVATLNTAVSAVGGFVGASLAEG